jgi:hypothetical protein
MATLKPCPHCGRPADFSQPFHLGEDGCRGSLIGQAPAAPPAEPAAAIPLPAPDPQPAPGGTRLVQCPEGTCGQMNRAGEGACVGCGAPLGQVGLRFPWGDVIAPDPVLVIGRDGRGPLAARLQEDEYDRVSRLHAQVTRIGNALVVEDLGSLNGTTVNGRSIGAPVEVRAGDRIGFSQALVVEVTVA